MSIVTLRISIDLRGKELTFDGGVITYEIEETADNWHSSKYLYLSGEFGPEIEIEQVHGISHRDWINEARNAADSD